MLLKHEAFSLSKSMYTYTLFIHMMVYLSVQGSFSPSKSLHSNMLWYGFCVHILLQPNKQTKKKENSLAEQKMELSCADALLA